MNINDAVLLETRAKSKGWEIESQKDDLLNMEIITMINAEKDYMILIYKKSPSSTRKRASVSISAFDGRNKCQYPFQLVNG